MKEQTVPTPQRETTPDTRESELRLTPPVDIFESDEGLVVLVDLPGVQKEEVQVGVADSVLTIEATPRLEERGEPLRREFTLRPYYRQFQLSEKVDQERISAEMRHGVLVVRLPRVAERPPKKIDVAVGA